MRKTTFLLISCLLVFTSVNAQRWKIKDDKSIVWEVKGQAHSDHIEMGGKRMATVLRYGVDESGKFRVNKSMVWPMLRTIPNNTHASLMRRFDWNPLDGITINGRSMDLAREQVGTIKLNGTMLVESIYTVNAKSKIQIRRTYIPSTDNPSLVEIYELSNIGEQDISIEIPTLNSVMHTSKERGVDGSYRIELLTQNTGYHILKPSQSVSFTASLSAYKKGEVSVAINAEEELSKRTKLVDQWTDNLVLETPDPVINEMFSFSKIRACESIYATKGGPMHGPGGESYYAAIWANDQAEYINPYFPFIGYDYGNESALNSFNHFGRFMNAEWKPIPSSIIAEGDDIWAGAGDRGDGAMVAYGAARYALARGSKQEAEQLWPLIEWCLEYSHRKLNDKGVVSSDSDELEGRFPSGTANLCTSSLYYDALLSASYLAKELNKGSAIVEKYRQQASELEKNIDSYFAANVEGYDTYAYYEGNDILRAWICIPLTVGIDKRTQGTIDALFSPRLWTDNGLLTQAGDKTFWDRSTLYALRGVFMAGEIEKAMKFLKHYSSTRLLGNHVPYAVEAWPEGEQRHLSAESALYGRIITEGLFGIRPTGFKTFTITPRLPQEWDTMSLRKVKAFDAEFDVKVVREGNQQLRLTISQAGKDIINKKIKEGASLTCKI